jgi:PmbA protein
LVSVITKSEREQLVREVLALSAADETEVVAAFGDSALTRFTHEVSNQNVATRAGTISVRAIVGKRAGVASTNSLDAQALRTTVDRAIAMARLSPKDPMLPPLPVGEPQAAPPGSFVDVTARAAADRRAAICESAFRAAEASRCWSAGFASTAAWAYTIANTRGALSSFDGTDAAFNVKMIAADSSGWAEMHTPDVGVVDAESVAKRAVGKAMLSASPKRVAPGAWTVVFESAAFAELLAHLGGHFSAQSYDDGTSFCSGGLDRQHAGENVTILDDYAHPLRPGMPFDFEGYPTKRLALIEDGVVRNIVTDSYYAHKLGRENTGHALPAPNAYGPQPRNLVVAPGSTSFDELIAQIERGILVTRLWYIRTVDQKQTIVTGMTRDGTFLIENGRISCGIHNMRFNQSILEALRHCTLASEQRRSAAYDYDVVAPAARIDGFTFTSATEF